MLPHIRFARRTGRALAAVLAAALAACTTGDEIVHDAPRPASLQVLSRNPQPGVAGQRLPEIVRVRVVNADGEPMEGVNVTFTVTGGGTILPGAENTDAYGFVQVLWTLGAAGPQTAVASVIGAGGAQLCARIVQVPATAAPMLGLLGNYITASEARMVEGLPRNPQAAPFMEAKIAMLRTPGLGGDIIDTHRYLQGRVTSRSGAELPVTAVFPREAMRGEAGEVVRLAERALPVLEAFLDRPFPTPGIRLWYGFVVGSSGGGGSVSAEDRTTYDARLSGGGLPYDPMIVHELGHTYIYHESLNQFLELYGYNVVMTGSPDLAGWAFTRGWVPGREDNAGIHALLDVYQLIGPDAMRAAYRAILPLQPQYGEPVPAAVREAFVSAVPAQHRPQVAAKLAKVVY